MYLYIAHTETGKFCLNGDGFPNETPDQFVSQIAEVEQTIAKKNS